MKSLSLLVLAALPLSAHANGATTLVCASRNSVDFTLVTKFGVQPGSNITIVANGILHTVIDTRVDQVRATPGLLSADVTTVNADGQSDDTSGTATLEFDVAPGAAEGQPQQTTGTARIKITKTPPRHPLNIRFQSEYDLSDCQGAI